MEILAKILDLAALGPDIEELDSLGLAALIRVSWSAWNEDKACLSHECQASACCSDRNDCTVARFQQLLTGSLYDDGQSHMYSQTQDDVQLSTVSKSFREAAKRALAWHNALDLAESSISASSGRMDSALLLDWAPTCIGRMMLNSRSLSLPGLPMFMQAAASMCELEIHCDSLLAAAQADAVLAACPCLETLRCYDWYVPTVVPAKLEVLFVDLDDWADACAERRGPDMHAEALLYRLAPLQCLKELSIGLGDDPRLRSTVKLPRLETVAIWFRLLKRAELDLSWLQLQPVDDLDIHVVVCTDRLAEHTLMVQQLQLLSLGHLRFSMHCEVEPEVQRVWAQVTVTQHLWLSPREVSNMHVVALPQCKSRSIWAPDSIEGCLVFTYDVLTSCAGRISLWPGERYPYHILDFSGQAPAMTQPWELSIYEPLRVHGISLTKLEEHPSGEHTLRNTAATQAAGLG